MTSWRIGIDVGGTFTDFTLADMTGQRLLYHKEPSVAADPSLAVGRGIQTVLDAHAIDPEDVELIVHGTTIGLNAIIQRRGAPMALVTSAGCRDVLEIARLRLPSSYDFTVPREQPLVPRNLVFEVSARMRSDGSVETKLNPAEVRDVAARIRQCGARAVAIMLLNSYRDPSLEIQLAAALQKELPGVLISASAVVWPEVREYERCLVAGLNAYIHPLMSQYLDRLQQRVSGQHVAAPIYITANNGGTLALGTARARPIDTVLSGPASGVVASARIAAVAGQTGLVTFDMGGTSADIAVCPAGQPAFTTSTHVGDFPLMLPVVSVSAIGAGGGSVLWVDAQGLLKIGPHSAGADPGPACYGRGGQHATITDCYVALGIVDPHRFLGGRMTLDAAAAIQALDEVAAGMGLAGPDRAAQAAEAALQVASAKMGAEITKLLAEAGVDPRDFALVAYGGAGPTHAALLAEEVPLPSVLVPMAPGTFCALGAILADVRRDYVRTARHLVGGGGNGWDQVALVIGVLQAEAAEWVRQEGALVGEHGFLVSLAMRYPGQAYEIEVALPEADRAGLDGNLVAALFHERHLRLYGFSEPGSAVQTTTVRLGVIGAVPPVTLPDVEPALAMPLGSRTLRHRGASVSAAVYERAALGAGSVIEGPAIVEQPDTTTLVLPGWRASADRIGTLRLTRA